MTKTEEVATECFDDCRCEYRQQPSSEVEHLKYMDCFFKLPLVTPKGSCGVETMCCDAKPMMGRK